MPDLYTDIPEETPQIDSEEQAEVRKILEYTEEGHNPLSCDYNEIIAKCYNFKELNQWGTEEKRILEALDVPEGTPDRINRSLETLEGIKENSNFAVKVTKRELGDEGVAELFQKSLEFIKYESDYEEASDEAFENLRDVGIGLRVYGWDQNLMGGEGMFWFDNINPEDCGWSYTRKKNFANIRHLWYRVQMDWQDAIKLNPEKAPALNNLKSTLQQKWEEIKGESSTIDRDYSGNSGKKLEQKNSVYIWNVWVKRTIPYKKVGYLTTQPMSFGNESIDVPLPSVKKVPIDYQLAEGEQDNGSGVDEVWYLHQVATGKGKESGILLTPIGGVAWNYKDPPVVPMVAEFKKNGQPRGFIEKAIPHQIRINIAHVQQIAYNNHAIKSAAIIRTQDGTFDTTKAEQQTQFGGILILKQGEELLSTNITPNVNLHALEEGTQARQDMDSAIAATEPVLMGQSHSGDSGVKTATLQNAAITPLNKWMKAYKKSELQLAKQLLPIIIDKFTPQRLMRIVGQNRFMQLFASGALPKVNAADYDLVASDQAISDLNKQQSFNSAVTLVQMGYGMEAEYMFNNAPMKNPEEALQSHYAWKQDQMRMLMMENEFLHSQLDGLKKALPKNGGQAANAQRGKSQSQAGQQSMIGGAKYANQ